MENRYFMFIKQCVIDLFSSTQNAKNQAGFSLLIVLLTIAVIGTVFSSLLFYQRSELVEQRAFAAGWHIVQISKAARVYVRDRSTSGLPADTAFEAGNLGGGSIEVSVNDLITAGHLPAGFPDSNPLGQQTRIFAATFPPAGGVGAVSTAYVITELAGSTQKGATLGTASTIASLMQGAREAGLSASSPLVVGGTNFSEDCNGSPAIMIWDTGCLNGTDVDVVTAGAVGFDEGQIIVPSWRAFTHDLRAVMRFPQPENVTANTMATNLHFWDPVTPTADVYDGAGGVVTNNRTNIIGVGSLNIASLIATDQNATSGPDEDVTDNLGLSGGIVTDTQRVFNVQGNLTISQNLTVSNNGLDLPNVLHLPENAGLNQMVIGQNMAAEELTVTSVGGTTGQLDTESNINVDTVTADNIRNFDTVTLGALGNTTNRLQSLTVTGSAAEGDIFLADQINDLDALAIFTSGREIRILSDLTFNPGGTLTTSGSNPFSSGQAFRARTIDDAAISVSDTITLDKGGQLRGNVSIDTLSVDTCIGACPTEVGGP